MKLPYKASAGAYVQGTGTTSILITIPPGDPPTTLPVIDHVLATTINGTAGAAITVAAAGVTILRKTIATAVADFADVDFSGGYPIWAAGGNNTEPYRSPNIHTPPSSQTSYPVYGGTAGSGELNQGAGMSFTVGSAGYTMYGVGFLMDRVGEPSDTITVTLRTISINGSVVATSEAVNLTWADYRTNRFVYFPFQTPVLLNASTKYFMRITRSGSRDTANYTAVRATTGSALASAGAYTLDNTTWSAESGTDDLLFAAVAGVDLFMTAPASSTGSTLTATYHYLNPGDARN